jgi:hypothetical protein
VDGTQGGRAAAPGRSNPAAEIGQAARREPDVGERGRATLTEWRLRLETHRHARSGQAEVPDELPLVSVTRAVEGKGGAQTRHAQPEISAVDGARVAVVRVLSRDTDTTIGRP